MRVPLTALLCLALAPAAWAQPSLSPADEQAVKELVGRYNAVRDLDDPAAIEALFTADADQLVSSGEWRRGRQALVDGMRKSTQSNPGRRTLTVDTVRPLTTDVAIADARYEIEEQGGATRRMWSTFLAVRTANGWRIAALRNMLPAK
mgnify:FL=1